jgi:thiol-disulfide isomerase/thioredoxin
VRAALVLAVIAACTPAGHVAPPPPTMPATARLVDAVDGTTFAPAERWHGQVVVVDFWASWCKGCKQSVPRVSRLAQAFAANGLVVVGVNVGDKPEAARAAAAALSIAYPIALDPDFVVADQLGASQLPMVLVIDRAGAIVHRSREVDPDTLAIVRKLLGVTASAN